MTEQKSKMPVKEWRLTDGNKSKQIPALLLGSKREQWEVKGSSSKLSGTEDDVYWLNKITFMISVCILDLFSSQEGSQMKQSTSWKKARNNPPAIFHLYCPLGRVYCTDYLFEKFNCALKETKACL